MNDPAVTSQDSTPPAPTVPRVLEVSDLSRDQRAAYDAILGWIRTRSKPVLSMGGLAGTGKSAILSLLARERLGPVAFTAPTGKAASILRRRLGEGGVATRGRLPKNAALWTRYGLDPEAPFCGTLHSLVYAPVEDQKTGRVTGWAEQAGLDRDYRLLVCDEASMASDAVVDHLRSYGAPVLLVGDHGQLPPVRGCSQAMLRPDLRLEKIHRQAEGNPIVRLAARVRETGAFDPSLADGDRVVLRPERDLRDVLDSYEVLRTAPGSLAGGESEESGESEAFARLRERAFVVYTNKRRVSLNAAVRGRLGRGAAPEVGDQVICLKNRPGTGVYNGMRGFLTEVGEGLPSTPWQIRGVVDFPDEGIRTRLDLCGAQFGRPGTFEEFEQVENAVGAPVDSWGKVGALFDYGYVVTGHKMQGAQAAEILVLGERPSMVDDDTWKRWLYTAVTRATERVTILA